MMESAESNFHRMLALADDLYEADNEDEVAHGQGERDGGNGPRRRRRAPLRERVDIMTERRREEQSPRGVEEREMRLERRRRQWEAAAAAATSAHEQSPVSSGDEKAKKKGTVEGLGRSVPSYVHPCASTPFFGDEDNLWADESGEGNEKISGDDIVTSMSSDAPIHQKEEASEDTFLTGVDDANPSLADLRVPLWSSDRQFIRDQSAETVSGGQEISSTRIPSTRGEQQYDDTYIHSSKSPSNAQKPSLMDLLGDDLSFDTHANNMSTSRPLENAQTENEIYEPPSSLMELLNENFNVPPANHAEEEEVNLDLDVEQRPPGSLMDLLSEAYSSSKSNDATGNSADVVSQNQSFDLFGLDADGEDSEPKSLLHLMDKDEKQLDVDNPDFLESDSHFTFESSNSKLSGPSNAPISSSSLDLINDNVSVGEGGAESDIVDTRSPSDSLLGLMDDISYGETLNDADNLVGLLGTDSSTSLWESHDLDQAESLNASETVDELLSLLVCATKKEWDEITQVTEPSLVEEAEREAGYLLEEVEEVPPAKAITFGEDILSESSKLSLEADEINLALLNLAIIPPTLQSMEVMVKLFKFMEENRQSGKTDAAPNAATYTLLMVAFGDRGNDYQAAKFVCERMMEAMDKNGLTLDSNAVAVGARCLEKVGDIVNAEKLLSASLGETGSGVEVSSRVFRHTLALYKEDNLQEEALKLLDVFITEAGVDRSERVLDDFVKSVIRWPKRNRRGNRIALSLHHRKIFEYLETHCIEDDDADGLETSSNRYQPSYYVWRELLRSLFRAARQESKGQYELVRRACRCLVNSSRDETHPDHFVLQAGLTAAEALGDAKLASDVILWAWENAEQFVETQSNSHGAYTYSGIEAIESSTEFSVGLSQFSVPLDPTGNKHDDLDAEMDSLFGDASIGVQVQEDAQNEFDDESPSGLLSLLDSNSASDKAGGDTPFGAANEGEWNAGQDLALDSEWSHSEQESEPPRRFVHIPSKAYYSAIKICLARGEPKLAHAVLSAGCVGPSDDIDMRLPDSSRSHLFNLVIAAYSQVGDFENAQSLLCEMQTNGPRPTERTYAAVITSLAMADKVNEAADVIDAMLGKENDDAILPGSSSFSACMLAALKAKKYQQVLDLNAKMIDAGIAPNSQSYFGVVLASTRLGDRASALKAAESALESKLPINHQGLNLLMKALLPDSFGDGSIASIRNKLRSLGLENKNIAAAANSLSRSLRMVETEERRPKGTKNVEKCEEMWIDCLRDLCALVHQKDGF